jgi:hypothetical protein
MTDSVHRENAPLLREDSGTEVPNAKAVVAFAKKCDDLITETIVKFKDLADDGEKLIDSNLLNAPETGTRNELVIHRIGTLRTIANGLSSFFERIRRFSP